MNYLPQAYGLKQVKREVAVAQNENPVLLVIGSVSEIGRKQLNQLLLTSNVVGLEMQSTKVILDSVSKESEFKRLIQDAITAFQAGKSIALFSSQKVKETQKVGREQGYNAIEISNLVSKALGELAIELINQFDIRRLFLTGGDTAQQVFAQLKINEFHLLDEVEPGIPLGKLDNNREILAVTKAGNFGTELAMMKAIHKLQGRSYEEACFQDSAELVN